MCEPLTLSELTLNMEHAGLYPCSPALDHQPAIRQLLADAIASAPIRCSMCSAPSVAAEVFLNPDHNETRTFTVCLACDNCDEITDALADPH